MDSNLYVFERKGDVDGGGKGTEEDSGKGRERRRDVEGRRKLLDRDRRKGEREGGSEM